MARCPEPGTFIDSCSDTSFIHYFEVVEDFVCVCVCVRVCVCAGGIGTPQFPFCNMAFRLLYGNKMLDHMLSWENASSRRDLLAAFAQKTSIPP